MNKRQFLLLKLSEECAEVSQRASKQIQFGRSEIQKDQKLRNGERLKREIYDFLVIVRMLEEELEIPQFNADEFLVAYKEKRVKLQKYLNLSAELGQLPEIKL